MEYVSIRIQDNMGSNPLATLLNYKHVFPQLSDPLPGYRLGRLFVHIYPFLQCG